MPMLRPFRGLRYAAPAVTDYATVICPPYDVITPAARELLAARSPLNAVHVELPTAYDEAGRLFDTWQRDGTLRRDDTEQIYVYEQRYRLDGQELTARGFMCRLRLAATGPGNDVRAHEHTMSGPREDRFRLLSAVHANLSPVILLYEAGPGLPAEDLLAQLTTAAPSAEAIDDGAVQHRLWAVDPATEPAAATLLAAVSALPLTIADGHHRYATALRYCAEVGGPGTEHVLALLFEAHSGGLSVLATHRLIKAPDTDVLGRAGDLFQLTPVASATDALPGQPGEIGMSTRAGAGRLHSTAFARDQSSPVAGLDVSVLAEALPFVVGASVDQLTASDRISYTQDPLVALAAVESDAADVAFLLAPTPVQSVIDVAAAGEVMPPKSTFFYPKAATGLVFNPLLP